MKKGIILNFSPNKQGVSKKLAKQISTYIQKHIKYVDIKLLNINDLRIKPCGDCVEYCYRYGKCKIKDDMQILYNHFEEDNFFIVVTPVYFYHIPGYAKLMIDRCQPYWVRKYVIKNLNLPQRISSIVCVGATKGEQLFSGINLTMKYFFDIFSIKFDLENNLYLRNIEKNTDLNKCKRIFKKYLIKLQHIIL